MQAFIVYDRCKIDRLGGFIMDSGCDFEAGPEVSIVEIIFGEREVFRDRDNKFVDAGKCSRGKWLDY